MHPYLVSAFPLAMAHRGGAGEGTENTLDAVARAVDLGFTHVETDARATADGVVLAFHDPDLGRLAGLPRDVGALRYAEVAALPLAGGGRIPTMAELLERFPDVRFNIDAKEAAVLAPLVRLLRDADALSRVCVASFSDARLAWLRAALGPGGCSSLGSGAVARLRAASVVPGLGWSGPVADCVQVPLAVRGVPVVDRRFLDAAHGAELAVHVWTVDDPATMHRLLDLGVDGLISDRPSVLAAVMAQRGCWPPRPPESVHSRGPRGCVPDR